MNKVYFAVLALLVSASAMAQNRLANSSNENLRKFTRTEITPMIAPRGTFDPKDFVRDGNILDEDFEDETLGTVPTDWSTNEVEQLDGDGIGTGEFTDAFVVHDAETANNGTYWPVPFLGGNINNKFAGVNDD
jgi:predicted patatin/cPLA2 family phospholipase